jgi:hypothetical protein
MNTVGIVLVACCIAFAALPVTATKTSGFNATSSRARTGNRSAFSAGNRFSSTIFLPSIYPKSFSPVRARRDKWPPHQRFLRATIFLSLVFVWLLPARHHRPRRRTSQSRDELAPSHPSLPKGRAPVLARPTSIQSSPCPVRGPLRGH